MSLCPLRGLRLLLGSCAARPLRSWLVAGDGVPGGRGTTSGRGNGSARRGEEKRGRLGGRHVSQCTDTAV